MKPDAVGKATRSRTGFIPVTTRQRSAITNGHKLLPDLDHRGAWARRLRDLIGQHVADLGGVDSCTEGELALVRCAAQLRLQLEQTEQHWAEHCDGVAPPRRLQEYQRTVGTLRRVLKTLGLERRSRDVTPTLQEYLTQKYPEGDADGAAE